MIKREGWERGRKGKVKRGERLVGREGRGGRGKDKKEGMGERRVGWERDRWRGEREGERECHEVREGRPGGERGIGRENKEDMAGGMRERSEEGEEKQVNLAFLEKNDRDMRLATGT